MLYALVADLIVAIHVAYVSYIIVGQLAILIGAMLHWEWIRRRWFRFTHLLAIVIVALEAVFGIRCPLTTWEANLRKAAGQKAVQESFIGRFLDSVLFYNVDARVLNAVYIAFALLVLATLILVPPRRARAKIIGNRDGSAL